MYSGATYSAIQHPGRLAFCCINTLSHGVNMTQKGALNATEPAVQHALSQNSLLESKETCGDTQKCQCFMFQTEIYTVE